MPSLFMSILEGSAKLLGRSRFENVKINSLVSVGLKTRVRFALTTSELLVSMIWLGYGTSCVLPHQSVVRRLPLSRCDRYDTYSLVFSLIAISMRGAIWNPLA